MTGTPEIQFEILVAKHNQSYMYEYIFFLYQWHFSSPNLMLILKCHNPVSFITNRLKNVKMRTALEKPLC
jgi:hypothetical protein